MLSTMSERSGQSGAKPLPIRRIVVKIGSAVIAPNGTLDPASVRRIAADVAKALAGGTKRQVVIVSSGAVASGFRSLDLARPPKDIVRKQAAAAVGQPRLMSAWADAFASVPSHPARRAGVPVAQVLLTAEDIDHRARFLNARRTLEALLDAGVVPVINENDSVSYAEIKLGDNDHLSSLVASLVDADLLVILSSVNGVWAAGKKGEVVPEIRSLAEGLKLVRSDTSSVGTGGMETKIRAACRAAGLGIGVVIASGAEPRVLERLAMGEAIGTRFTAAGTPAARAARKKWIGFSARPSGAIAVDDGALKAITTRGASLLPSGLTDVRGDFDAGDLIEIIGPGGTVFARGLSGYGSDDLARIKGRKTSEIGGILGFCYAEEAVHRDDLVLLSREPVD
jgi:glutamate 5-kinase